MCRNLLGCAGMCLSGRSVRPSGYKGTGFPPQPPINCSCCSPHCPPSAFACPLLRSLCLSLWSRHLFVCLCTPLCCPYLVSSHRCEDCLDLHSYCTHLFPVPFCVIYRFLSRLMSCFASHFRTISCLVLSRVPSQVSSLDFCLA